MNNKNEVNEAPGLSAPITGKKIFFVRHGKTEWNNQFRYQGVTDIPLCEEGREQARRTGLRFAKAKIEAIISSPLSRAYETAEKIACHHAGINVEKLDLLEEVNFGEWEGLTVNEIKNRFGEELFYKWRRNQLHVDAPGGEKMERLYARSSMVAKMLLARPEDNIVVVGHGAMLRALFLPMLELPRSNIFWKTRIDNCSISAFSVEAGNRYILSYLNDTLHLRDCGGEIISMPII